MATRRRRKNSYHEVFRGLLEKALPHISPVTLAEVASAVPDAKHERAKRPWREYGAIATNKNWSAQQRLGPVPILDAMDQLHQIYRADKDLYAAEQIQRVLLALDPIGRAFPWVDPPFNFSFVLVHTLRMLMTLIGPRGLRAGANDTVQRQLTEGKHQAWTCCEVVYQKTPLSRIKAESWGAEPAKALLDFFGILNFALGRGPAPTIPSTARGRPLAAGAASWQEREGRYADRQRELAELNVDAIDRWRVATAGCRPGEFRAWIEAQGGAEATVANHPELVALFSRLGGRFEQTDPEGMAEVRAARRRASSGAPRR